MSGIADVKRAIEFQRQYPDLLRLRWKNAALIMLGEGYCTVNEIGRTLRLKGKDKFHLYVNIRKLKCKGKVRRVGRHDVAEFKLVERDTKILDYIEKSKSEIAH